MIVSENTGYHRRVRLFSGSFSVACLTATLLCVLMLLVLLWSILSQGASRIGWDFLTSYPSRNPENAGIVVALLGSIWLIVLTALFSVPIGVGAAIYLEEYAPDSRLKKLIQINISNLAGVPSVVYGILGVTLFVRTLALGQSLLAGALTLTLVVLPIVILAAQEALRAVPSSIRQASYALGATRWQTVSRQVFPAAVPGIMTGIILALSRAIGEAAPLLAIGAKVLVTYLPSSPSDAFAALPLQIYNWVRRPGDDFEAAAAAGIIVLLVLLICMNSVAVFVRYRYGKRIRW